MSAKHEFDKQFTTERLQQIFTERIATSKSVGKVGVTARAFAAKIDDELKLIRSRIYSEEYRFTSFKQQLILKGAKKYPREIAIAGVRDRVTLRALTNALMIVFHDAKLAPAHFFIKEIVEFITPLDDEYVFLQLDVQDFYPSLEHQYLMNRVASRVKYRYFRSLILAAVTTATGDSEVPKKGVPQGLSVSNILASIYMMKVDKLARLRFQYFRYVDDILVICKKENAKRNLDFLIRQLKKLGLDCHPLEKGSKSKIVPLTQGVDYLGYHIKPNLISVRHSSYKRMMSNIISVITTSKYRTNQKRQLIKLNLKITGCIVNNNRFGWMFFFSMTQDMQQLKRLDRYVSKLWIKAGLGQAGKPKSFVKAYYEIRFNLESTKYIPKFDDYSVEQKIQLISDFQNIDIADVSDWTADKINSTFRRIVKREVSELEKDLTPIS